MRSEQAHAAQGLDPAMNVIDLPERDAALREDIRVLGRILGSDPDRRRVASAGVAYSAYRALVYETPGFERYFWESTVISEIANLRIGSRPASRRKSRWPVQFETASPISTL
jgi:hypothetical protein